MSEPVVPDAGKKVNESGWILIAAAAVSTLPALLFRFDVLSVAVEIETVFFGISILGAAFLLSWGAEVAQLDISQALAIAFLAFIAVLPEYAVDLTFAWKAGEQDAAAGALQTLCGVEEQCRQLAIANMTGANRLLIGLGWAAVVLIWALRTRSKAKIRIQSGRFRGLRGWYRRLASGEKMVVLESARRTELGFLLLATLWAFTIPIRGSLSLVDLAVLGTMFVAYIWRSGQHESEHPDLIGPPVVIAALPVAQRRAVTIGIFVFAATMILAAAEPFAEGLVHTGEKLGISSFLLVQWLAPLASEAPEMIIAILFVLRSKPGTGLGALVSSKVNQWTLLVGTIPLVYTLSRGGIHPMALDPRQVEEVLLTAAQSAFSIAILANLSISRLEASGLLVLFLAQFGFESTAIRYGFAGVYGVLLVVILVTQKASVAGLRAALRDALTPPWRTRRQASPRR